MRPEGLATAALMVQAVQLLLLLFLLLLPPPPLLLLLELQALATSSGAKSNSGRST
jgi:hypothetical protein